MDENRIEKLLKEQEAFTKVFIGSCKRLLRIQRDVLEELYKESLKTETENKDTSSEYLTSDEVCKMLDISKSTLFRMRNNDDFPSGNIEGRRKLSFNKKDIVEYLEKKKGV